MQIIPDTGIFEKNRSGGGLREAIAQLRKSRTKRTGSFQFSAYAFIQCKSRQHHVFP